ncbi:MAG: hypothetical protein M1828_003671 [Chrysothrix sp. TS-e1954]|nr:MAG: hypothetical protein M1828_003671 [Chrysothrix sp. TS-e1954]
MPATARRTHTDVFDYLDRVEGDGSELEDDPHISSKAKRAATKRLAIGIMPDLTSDVSTEDEVAGSNGEEGKRLRRPDPSGRVAWDEDEDSDAAYQSFKNRKRQKTKSGRASGKKSGTGKKRTKTSAVVGVRGKQKHEKPVRQARLRDNGQLESDSDEEKIEAELPDYIKKRRAELEENKTQLHLAGLRLPPEYENEDFSDDERMQYLLERPDMGDLKPRRPYLDIPMATNGIIPASIAQWLRDYQIEGAAKMHDWFVEQKGGILGDDMGLGKTIQVIAFLTAAFGKTGDERDAKRMRKMRRSSTRPWYPKVLIVCPGTLMENWRSELDKWGWWHIDFYHGQTAEKEQALQIAQNGRLEIMITTYSTYRINKGLVNLVEWDCVIADECHQVKERNSEISKAMNDINALCRIGLTGTAIQNNYEELWTLLNWTNPGRFGPMSTWKTAISQPLKIGQSHEATVPELARARSTARKLVNNLLPDFFLRRMKTLIADQLPKKSDRVVFCPLTPTQQDAYECYVSSLPLQYIRNCTNLCPCGSGKKRGWCCYSKLPADPDGDLVYENLTHQEAATLSRLKDSTPWQALVFPAIATLQKLSNHLAMLIPSSSDDSATQLKTLQKLQYALPDRWRDIYSSRDSITHYADQNFCGKWRILKRLLAFWHSAGDVKVLVFSHSVKLLKMLQTLFTATTSYTVSFLSGAMSYADRAAVVQDFNTSPTAFVFLISTKAGGVGLNITSANKVVIFDPNWNPSHDLQAQDRAYRIGQARDVDVFRLVSAGTIEEIVYARQIYKQQQANIGYNASTERRYFRGVQDTKEKKGEIFGLHNLFAYHGENVVLRDIVNKTNVAESKAGVSVTGLDFDSTPNERDIDDDEEIFDPSKPHKKSTPHNTTSHLAMDGENENDPILSHLEALISQGSPPSSPTAKRKTHNPSPVTAILASAGVSYTHDNAQVIGSSRIESRLSRRAEAKGSSKSRPENPNTMDHDQSVFPADDSGPHGTDEAGKTSYRYGPPAAVQHRQFTTLATEFLDYPRTVEGVTQFALVVEGWSQKQRRACLERFYKWRRGNMGADCQESKHVDRMMEVEEVKESSKPELELESLHDEQDMKEEMKPMKQETETDTSDDDEL